MAIGRILRFGARGPEAVATTDAVLGDPAEALQLMKSFEEACHGWFWSTDAAGRLTYISPSFARSLSGGEALLGARFAEIFGQIEDDDTGRRTLPFLLAREGSFERILVGFLTEEDPRCWSVSASPQHDASGSFCGFRGSAIDVTEQRRSTEHASQLAQYDALTGLPNRRRMAEMLDSRLAAARVQHRPCAVLLIDLDRFKQVNDTLGHPAGDALLKQVADRLSRLVGDRERVFRLGGDEFQVTLEGFEDRAAVGDLAAEMIASVSQPYSVLGSRCIIGASIGIAIAPTDGAARAELIRNADLALYASKSAGRGRYRFFSSELSDAAQDKQSLEEDLRDALARGELCLAYQPIVSATTNRITGVEALMRWEHPQRGAISPAVFIPVAEEAGLIPQLGEWAIRTACADAAAWPGTLRVAVNVSPIQFTNEALPATVTGALAASGLAPEQLELEITEGVFLGESAATDSMFSSLKKIGVRLALDDFGTGYSSLGYLRNAPFDKIKIDQTFVREATTPGSRNGAIIAAIVALAEALGMETTAEGIEYMDQLHLIRSLRVSHVQGWVYSKAVSAAELSRRLAEGGWIFDPAGPARQRSERQAVYRKAGIVHANRYSTVILRNLSESGALVQNMPPAPVGTLVLVDLGDGQLSLARVVRQKGERHGIAFEQPLIDDGNGGLCTRHRVSRYVLGTAGFPAPGDEDRNLGEGESAGSLEELAGSLGLAVAAAAPHRPALMNLQWSSAHAGPQDRAPTFAEMSGRYLEAIGEEEDARADAARDFEDHVLPQFGERRLDEVGRADILAWLDAKADGPGGEGTDARLHALMKSLWTLARELKLPGSEHNPLEGSFRYDRRGGGEAALTTADAARLLAAAAASQNRQLKYILSLLMLTGARPSEILGARWGDVDLEAGAWRLTLPGLTRELKLAPAALELLRDLPRVEGCPFLLPNPVTGRPYLSIGKSWEVARSNAGLAYLEIEDLRYCDLGGAAWAERLLGIVKSASS
jgi:diguanylate cyclase (GGDEF)-like protein